MVANPARLPRGRLLIGWKLFPNSCTSKQTCDTTAGDEAQFIEDGHAHAPLGETYETTLQGIKGFSLGTKYTLGDECENIVGKRI